MTLLLLQVLIVAVVIYRCRYYKLKYKSVKGGVIHLPSRYDTVQLEAPKGVTNNGGSPQPVMVDDTGDDENDYLDMSGEGAYDTIDHFAIIVSGQSTDQAPSDHCTTTPMGIDNGTCSLPTQSVTPAFSNLPPATLDDPSSPLDDENGYVVMKADGNHTTVRAASVPLSADKIQFQRTSSTSEPSIINESNPSYNIIRRDNYS